MGENIIVRLSVHQGKLFLLTQESDIRISSAQETRNLPSVAWSKRTNTTAAGIQVQLVYDVPKHFKGPRGQTTAAWIQVQLVHDVTNHFQAQEGGHGY